MKKFPAYVMLQHAEELSTKLEIVFKILLTESEEISPARASTKALFEISELCRLRN